MMHIVTKATPISNIDSKCHTKKLISNRICLISYSGFISCEWYLITCGRTHTHNNFPDKASHVFGWHTTGLINGLYGMYNFFKQIYARIYEVYNLM